MIKTLSLSMLVCAALLTGCQGDPYKEGIDYSIEKGADGLTENGLSYQAYKITMNTIDSDVVKVPVPASREHAQMKILHCGPNVMSFKALKKAKYDLLPLDTKKK
ncbi:hypothetical protein [Falsibacillus albus]|uniref:Lipoprotein n=1 Tax=Falsibacillus albus TaxID=2478915 RepID=A0A3L7JPY3_9BACI|nr:hypothetical protein [Falsibacillus albus]RLQ92315.1 hypothetical protein D9X91_19775 [Falsibacillus albus]